LSREEFDRYSRFNSWGSARETFDWSELCRVLIPLPLPEVQQAIVDVYNCAEEAKKIATLAREKMKMLCPALVQRAING
jgi:type I restriction enzyme, S subunit